LKQLITIFLALLVFLQPFTKAWIFVSFKMNQEYIAETLCVQKEIPRNTCHGECQLMKRLKKVEQAEQQQKPPVPKLKIEVLFCHQLIDFQLQTIFSDTKEIFIIFYRRLHPMVSIDDFFHPPKSQYIFIA